MNNAVTVHKRVHHDWGIGAFTCAKVLIGVRFGFRAALLTHFMFEEADDVPQQLHAR